MPPPTDPTTREAQALNLDAALQLLEQSGHRLPDLREAGKALWLQAVIDGLCELSSRDPLTGLANRRHFELMLAGEVDRVARAGEPALVLLIDIDHFKKVNDAHGHPAGDEVLKHVAHTLQDCIRPMDTVARFGGEEFAMILPNCPPSFAQAVAERIRDPGAVDDDSDLARRDGADHGLARRRVRAAVGALVGTALGRARRPAALSRQVRRPQPRLPRAAGGFAGHPRGEGPAVRHFAFPGFRMSTPPGRRARPPRGAGRARAAAGHHERTEIMAVTSGKGGVGKTFVSANLAAALAERGERVLVLDADLGLANLDVVFNLFPKNTLHDVFTGKATLEQAILPAPGGFSVLLAGSGLVEYSRLTPQVRDQLADIIVQLTPRFDRILLDTGAGISDVVLHAVSLADDVLVIVTPEPTSMTDAYATIKVLATLQKRRHIRLIVNQVSAAGEGRTIRNQLQLVVDRFVAPQLKAEGDPVPLVLELTGEIPIDPSVREAVSKRSLLLDVDAGVAGGQGGHRRRGARRRLMAALSRRA